MFGSRSYTLVLGVCLALFAATAVGTQTIISGKFVERKPEWSFGFLKGKFYYLYDSENNVNSRLVFDYDLQYQGKKVTNLFHYEDKARYSQDSENCTGLVINEVADPWWLGSDLFIKTGEKEDGYFWYERNTSLVSTSTQVMRILMKEGVTAPSAGYLKRIEFYDERIISFSDVVVDTTHPASDPIFAPISACPRPTCPIYADIVFVLDSSGSVNHTEWAETVNFVNAVMNSFTFGPNAVEAAIVQFNGQDDGRGAARKKIYDPDCYDVNRYKQDCVWPKKNYDADLMASVKASADYGEGETVSPNRDELMRQLNATVVSECVYTCGNQCQAFKNCRGTNQALGLNLAMKVLSRSPRRNLIRKPANIIIAVTDGEDTFPNMTARNASLVKKEPYNALLIEVGVGLQCDYDRRYLMSIASRLGSDSDTAYYDAKDYGAIKKIAEELFRPLCEANFSSECGADCKGFCGAGQCLCPDCDESADICHMIKCNVSGSFSNGCVVYDTKYKDPNDFCNTWYCDPEKETGNAKKGEWIDNLTDCGDHPGLCRNVFCDAERGECRYEYNEYCNQFNTPCEQWECTPFGETPVDTVTGCRVKENYTQQCVDQLGAKSGCFEVVCDGSSTECDRMLVDTCTSMNTACMTWACTENATTGEYQCVGTETPHPADTNCTEWVCIESGENAGWRAKVDRTEQYCKELFNQTMDITCKNFYCNPDKDHGDGYFGCYYENRTGCDYQCTAAMESDCFKNGTTTDATNCVFDYCYVYRHDEENYTIGCATQNENLTLGVNCLAPDSASAKRAQELNAANRKQCWTPFCDYGKCSVEQVRLPDGFIETKCMEPLCVQGDDYTWHWEMFETTLKQTCLSDACFSRECNATEGCISTDICTVNSNECDRYSCEKEDGEFVCKRTDLTVNFTHLECLEEICDRKNGKRVTVYHNCTTEDLCMKASCVNGYCVYTPTSPVPEGEELDICVTYSCDNTTGEWTWTPNCDDGLACTMDECWNYGSFYECHHDNVDCSLSLSMEGYDCFRPFCKENLTAGNYKCIRKLLKDAFIDICGQCIRDNPYEEDSNTTSSSQAGALVACTDAPAKPMMIETLAAATIGFIIIAAVIVGAAITTSSIIGTRTLIKRARASKNLAAQSNPLFEGAETELTNPTYAH